MSVLRTRRRARDRDGRRALRRIDDVVARDSSGNLWLYPGTGTGGSVALGTRVSLGTGWQNYTIAAVGDFNKDGNADVVARDYHAAVGLTPAVYLCSAAAGASLENARTKVH